MMVRLKKEYTSPPGATTGLATYPIEGQRLRVTARARRKKVRVRATSTGG